MNEQRAGLVNFPVTPKCGRLVGEESAPEEGHQGTGELPDLIAFDDIFSQDDALKKRLDEIVDRVCERLRAPYPTPVPHPSC
jgi:hypothetical protein